MQACIAVMIHAVQQQCEQQSALGLESSLQPIWCPRVCHTSRRTARGSAATVSGVAGSGARARRLDAARSRAAIPGQGWLQQAPMPQLHLHLHALNSAQGISTLPAAPGEGKEHASELWTQSELSGMLNFSAQLSSARKGTGRKEQRQLSGFSRTGWLVHHVRSCLVTLSSRHSEGHGFMQMQWHAACWIF